MVAEDSAARVLITGADGQLGTELANTVPGSAAVRACTRRDLDITDPASIADRVDEFRPGWIVNSAAYTAVDRAESEPEEAFRVNADSPGHLASAAGRVGARLIHVSTDFVFDGERGRAYRPADEAAPMNAYGRSKLAGEWRLREVAGDTAVVIRTAWVYARQGRNFVNTMLRLMAEREQVRVVVDQIGSPTWARSLAEVIWSMILTPGVKGGTYHFTDAGAASWYDFAVAVREEGRAAGLLKNPADVVPVTTEEFPTPAGRPPFSVLACHLPAELADHRRRHWREALRGMLARPTPAGPND